MWKTKDALADEAMAIAKAIESRDVEGLRKLAHIVAAEDEEHGMRLMEIATEFDREDMSFDEARDNGEI
jgi:hypothetical protein